MNAKHYDYGVCSLFRDSQKWNGWKIKQVDRYMEQVFSQTLFKDKSFCVYALEGNSADDTYEVLLHYAAKHDNITVIKDDGSTTPVESTGAAERFKSLTRIGNIVLDAARAECDHVFYIESDFIVGSDCFAKLEYSRNLLKAGMVAPFPSLETNHNMFYDTWGFVSKSDSQHWSNYPPFHADYISKERYIEMLSVGSCALIDGEYLSRGASFGENCFQELSRQVRELGGSVWVDKEVVIYHPSTMFMAKRWV